MPVGGAEQYWAIVATAMALATSPPDCPPIPSDTINNLMSGTTRQASSLLPRTRPTSVRDPIEISAHPVCFTAVLFRSSQFNHMSEPSLYCRVSSGLGLATDLMRVT